MSANRGRHLRAVMVSLASVLLAACAPAPLQQIAAPSRTRPAISEGERPGAERDGSTELTERSDAREKITREGTEIPAPLTTDVTVGHARHLHLKATDRGLTVTLDDVLFETATANLSVSAAQRLDELAAFLIMYPERNVLLEGHTDSIGSDERNFRLSRHRAQAVKSYLTAHGIDAARLETVGVGKSDPVAGNDTAAGRRENRSVAVIIDDATGKPR